MSAIAWTVVGVLALQVQLCHINILILRRWVRDLNGGPHITESGRCGNGSPDVFAGVPRSHCDLTAGHDGWHRSYDKGGAVPEEWSR